MLSMVLVVQGLDALAQDFDAHGPSAPPELASVRDPVLGFGATHPSNPVITVQGVAASDLLVARTVDGDVVTDTPVVDDLFGARLTALVPFGDRVAVGATLPTWFGSSGLAGGGLALGDAGLWVPVRILGRADGLGLAVVPFLSVPSGADARYLGSPGGGGVLASLGFDRAMWTAHLDLGLDLTAPTDAAAWPGGLHGRAALDLGVIPTEHVGAHLELTSRMALARLGDVPSEALVAVKGRASERMWISAAGGRAITRGIGAPGMRLMLGVSGALGRDTPVSTVPLAGPDAKEVHVVDERSFPLQGARIIAGGVVVETDPEGYAALPPRSVRDGFLRVEHAGFEPYTLTGISVDDPFWEVTLRRAPVPVAVSVVGPRGPLASARVDVVGPADAGAPSVDEAGVLHWTLTPGTWTVSMESPGFGAQQRTVVIDPSRIDPIRVDAVLTELVDPDTALTVVVVDALGRPVEDAVVALGDRDLGTTGTGGDLGIVGLAAGEHALVVRSDVHGEGQVVKVDVRDGPQEVRATLDWKPGSVQVRVADAAGAPTDARVTFSGPATLPARRTGSDGEELFVLRPGTWDVRIEAEDLGTQTRTVEVGDQPGALVTLDVGLRRDEGGPAALELRVVDADGAPLPDVRVSLDGEPVGRTGPGGDLGLWGLATGARALRLEGDLLVPVTTPVRLVPGRQAASVAMGWVDGVVDLVVTGPEGRPVDARVSVQGPAPVAPVQVGRDGRAQLVLPNGDWTLTVSAPELGVQARSLVVEEGTRRQDEVRVQLHPVAPEVANLALTVVDPVGMPVRGVEVTLAGVPIGRLATGEMRAQGVPRGPVDIGVSKEGMIAETYTIELIGDTTLQIPMAYLPGAIRVVVEGPDGPLDAQIEVVRADEVSRRTAVGGTASFQVNPGPHRLIVTAPGWQSREVEVVVPVEARQTEVVVAMDPVAPKQARVVLQAQTPEGVPVAGAEVRVGGQTVGVTSSAGTITFGDGPDAILFDEVELVAEIVPDRAYLPVTVEVPVTRGESRHTVIVPVAPEAVAVTVVGRDGQPVVAEVAAVGAVSVAPVTLDAGQGTLALTPGTWTVTAKTAAGAVATTDVRVTRGEVAPVALVVDTVTARLDADRVMPASPVLFDLGKAGIRADAAPLIDDLARWLRANQGAALVEIAGHTDDTGGVVFNQQLSEQRAQSVKGALVARGVAPERLVARGYGLSRPATSGTDDASRQRNRRVEVVVRQWEGG